MTTQRKRYSKEFKLEAVRLLEEDREPGWTQILRERDRMCISQCKGF